MTGYYVEPTASVPHTASDARDQVDIRWHAEADKLEIHDANGEFLLRTSSPGSVRRGWLRVRDTVGDHLPSRITAATGYREFIAVSLDGRALCAVSVEDDEDWIVTHVF
ncbi:hypothetical protein ACFV9D_18745 [Streptomyces sp. NPDC059875]|uniref:hypothetical protein n=1 Tax=unclassified Streptomyces TaxID=2593676 RepID=UPI0036652C16